MQWWRTVARYPPTWVALGLTGLAVTGLAWWFRPEAADLGLLIGAGALSLAAWPAAVLVTGTERSLRRRLTARLSAVEDPLPALRRDLAALPDQRPLQQLDAVMAAGDSLTAILGRRLDTGEVTYARYVTATRNILDAVTHNLSEVTLAFAGVRTIDPVSVEQRLGELGQAPGPAAQRERESLTARLTLWQDQRRRIDALLAENEEAITSMARTSTALSSTSMATRRTDVDEAMADLDRLAIRATRYSGD